MVRELGWIVKKVIVLTISSFVHIHFKIVLFISVQINLPRWLGGASIAWPMAWSQRNKAPSNWQGICCSKQPENFSNNFVEVAKRDGWGYTVADHCGTTTQWTSSGFCCRESENKEAVNWCFRVDYKICLSLSNNGCREVAKRIVSPAKEMEGHYDWNKRQGCFK